MENSNLLDVEGQAGDLVPQNDQEVRLLAMFRRVSDQRQKDILRIMEAFLQTSTE